MSFKAAAKQQYQNSIIHNPKRVLAPVKTKELALLFLFRPRILLLAGVSYGGSHCGANSVDIIAPIPTHLPPPSCFVQPSEDVDHSLHLPQSYLTLVAISLHCVTDIKSIIDCCPGRDHSSLHRNHFVPHHSVALQAGRLLYCTHNIHLISYWLCANSLVYLEHTTYLTNHWLRSKSVY